LNAVSPDGFEYYFVDEEFVVDRELYLHIKFSDESNTILYDIGILTIFFICIAYMPYYVTGFPVLYWFGFFEE
jgi:hypothetical protein